jgi:hypothetical protein
MNEKSKNFKINLNFSIVLGFILMGLGWFILRSRWVLFISCVLFCVTFSVSMIIVLKNRNFNNAEITQKKLFIEGLKGAFLSFSFMLITVFRLFSF